jgi:UDP-N-acetyl-D-glucosamine dehydrogenase
MPFYPGPGLGGHCLPIDPHYLSWKARSFEFYARFIELASEINSSMPYHVLKKITDALNSHKKCVNGAKLLIIGVAYKKNVGDTRESPALDVIEMLAKRGGEIVYFDPYVPEIQTDGHYWKSLELTDSLLKQSDCVIILTDHSCLDYQRIVEHAKLVVDARNATADVRSSRGKIVKI